MLIVCTINIWCDENGTLPLLSTFQKSVLQSNEWEKYQKKIPVEGKSIGYWPALIKIVKIIKPGVSLRNYHSQKELKETWHLTVMWCPWGYSETEKSILHKN